MSSAVAAWPAVALGEVLQPISRPVRVEPTQTYALLGMHWYAEGLYIKDRKPSTQIQADTLYEVREGDFVYNRLFAWKGSFGIADSAVDGCYVSNEFPCFRIDETRAIPLFLRWYFAQTSVWEHAQGKSSGSTPTSRLRLKELDLLAMEIPLPPLDEQRRIVGRIEALAGRIAQARGLRRESREDMRRLLLGEYSAITADAPLRRMCEVAPLQRRSLAIDGNTDYLELGVRSFGKGTFHKPALPGALVGTKKLFAIEPGDLLFNIVFAWEGAVAVAKPQDAGRVGSHRFLTCVPVPQVAVAPYLCFHFLTERGLAQLGEASPGGAGRNRTLGLKALENISVPVPALNAQEWFEQLLARAHALGQCQADVDAELEALLPAVLERALRGEL